MNNQVYMTSLTNGFHNARRMGFENMAKALSDMIEREAFQQDSAQHYKEGVAQNYMLAAG